MSLNIYKIKDINNIIQDYKIKFELYEKELEKITECIVSGDYQRKLKIPLLLQDFKDFYLKNKYTNRIKFQIYCYNISRLDNNFWELDFNDNIEKNVLNNIKILEIIKLENNDTIYLRMEFEQEKEQEESEQEPIDNSYLIDENDTESDIELLMSLV